MSSAQGMSFSSSVEHYAPLLLPALHRIQDEYGYLNRDALEQLSAKSGFPRYQLHSVASFFPHFQLTPPKKVVLRVCRDLSCHLAGSATMLKDLQSIAGEDVAVEGVSCLGRCDRAPAACVAMGGSGHEHFYHGRTAEELEEIVKACMESAPPPMDHDADFPAWPADSMVDIYQGVASDYSAVRKTVALRDASLDAGAEILRSTLKWDPAQIDKWRTGVIQGASRDEMDDPELAEAVLCWQSENDWAKGEELGGWSDLLLKEIAESDLRGLGGAGIPATQKWKDVRDAVRSARRRQTDDRAFIVVNGDESEPGTFKDRELLLRTPHIIIEAVVLAGLITEATQGFIYIRHEYEEQIEACRAEILRAEQLGICGETASVLGRPFPVSVFVSPGGYICGEQSALIEAMSDRRGEPRNMPPKLETNGLQDLPTLVSNVETFAWVPYIVSHGGQAYAGLGVNGWKGRRLFSISGDVKRPGVYEVPMGMTLRELVYGDQYCQGIAGDRQLKGFAPSGPSGGFLPAKLKQNKGLPRDHVNNKAWQELAARRGIDPVSSEIDILDLELELALFRALSPTQALEAGLVVYAEGRDMASEAVNSIEFFRNESCGKCVPCRVGSQKIASLGQNLVEGKIDADRWNNELVPMLAETGKAIELASICGLGRSVPVPLLTAISFFEEDIESHLTGPLSSGEGV